MKQIAFLLLMMLLCTSVFSQQKDIETEDTTGISAYISPFFETTSMIKLRSSAAKSGNKSCFKRRKSIGFSIF